MKRDDDFLRDLLLKLEADDDWMQILPGETLSHSNEESKERYHLELAADSGFVTAVGQSTFRLTAQGHDYLDAIRDEGIWMKTKSLVSEAGGNATLEIVKTLAVGFLKKKISQYTDIDLG